MGGCWSPPWADLSHILQFLSSLWSIIMVKNAFRLRNWLGFFSGEWWGESSEHLYGTSSERRHLCEREVCPPRLAVTEAGLGAWVWARGPAAVNAHDLEASWRELLGIHPPAGSGPGGHSPPAPLLEIGGEDHAVIPERMALSPTKGEKN